MRSRSAHAPDKSGPSSEGAKSPPARKRQPAAGNQALQSLFASGKVLTKLQVGSSSDPAEREADQMADAALSGASACTCSSHETPCPRCQAQRENTIRRKPKDSGGSPGSGGPSLGSGRPLAGSDRSFFEARYSSDLSGVRVHDNHRAAAAAAQLRARAFTIGSDIAFGEGEYSPGTSEGRRLLGHELAHVVQGEPIIRRQEDQEGQQSIDPSNLVCRAEEPGTCSLLGRAEAQHEKDYDPCYVVVTTLSNYELLAEYNSAAAVVDKGRDATGFFDYRNLQRRLLAEADRRVNLGHAWLAMFSDRLPEAIPDTLYRIVERMDGAFAVVAVPGVIDSGDPDNIVSYPLMTRYQFDHFLETHSVERVSEDTYRMRVTQQAVRSAQFGSSLTALGLYNNPLDSMLMDPYALDPSVNKWTGRMGETFYSGRARTGYGLFVDDLNSRTWVDRLGRVHQPTEENYPLMDFERGPNTRGSNILGTVRISVKTSMQANQAGRLSYYREGLQQMLDTNPRSRSMQAYVRNQPQFLGQQTTGPQFEANRSVVLQDSLLAVNQDDAAAFQQLLSDPTQPESAGSRTMWEDRGGFRRGQPPRSGWRQIFEGVMRENPVTVGSETFTTPDALDQARTRPLNPITQEQYVAAQRRVGQRASQYVVGHGGETASIGALRTSRTGLAAIPDAQLRPLLAPEFLRAERYGGGLGGNLRAGGMSGLQGAGTGGVIAVITTLGVMTFDEADHPNWEQELALTGGLGAGAGGLGSATEQLVVSTGTRAMLGQLSRGGVTALTPGVIGTGGRLAGGAVGAMFVEGISIGLLEDREHSGVEIGVRMARSGALGAGSVWAGAAAGTAVGGPVGFIVGLAVGGLLYWIGDKITPGGREYWERREAGCVPPEPPHIYGTRPGEFSSAIFKCFESETPVLMADGTSRHIYLLRPGDRIRSYNQDTQQIETQPVKTVHRNSPDRMLELAFEDGIVLRVTGGHKLGGPGGWRECAQLRVGDEVFATDSAEAPVCRVVKVISSTTIGPRGPVYDLSVASTHTYFANGILAHNKI